MGSNSKSSTKNDTNNLALDRSSTNGEGVQILDSIIVDPSDKVMVETIKHHGAAFEVMMSNSTVQMSEIRGLGEEVLKLVDGGMVRLEGMAYEQLRSGVEMLQLQMQQGKYVVDFVDMTVNRTFDLASDVADGNDDRLEQALNIVAEAKTGNYSDTLKFVTGTLVVFALGAMYILKD